MGRRRGGLAEPGRHGGATLGRALSGEGGGHRGRSDPAGGTLLTLAQVAAVATAVVLGLSTGFSIGFFIGHPGPLVFASMTNRTANLTAPGAQSGAGYPCTS